MQTACPSPSYMTCLPACGKAWTSPFRAYSISGAVQLVNFACSCLLHRKRGPCRMRPLQWAMSTALTAYFSYEYCLPCHTYTSIIACCPCSQPCLQHCHCTGFILALSHTSVGLLNFSQCSQPCLPHCRRTCLGFMDGPSSVQACECACCWRSVLLLRACCWEGLLQYYLQDIKP